MNKKTLIGVLGLAQNVHGQYLITQRNDPQNPRYHRKWNIPGGGMEFGEQPEETLAREFREELSVTPQIIMPTPVVITYLQYRENTSIHLILMCYLVNIGNQKITLDMKENIDFTWVDINTIDQIRSLPGTKKMMHKVHELHIHNKANRHYNTPNR